MPEIVRAFSQGRMNKDLDERIIPNGEYRDALNLEISASEDSDQGTFENIKGNIELKHKTYNSNTLVYSDWNSNYISDLTNAICVGAIRNSENEKIYWLVASDEASVIAEYDQTTDLVKPIVVDKNNILKLSKDYLITGINIIDGVLLWTDNNSEPKKVIIEDWYNSTPNFSTHSKIYGRDFIEQDVTVIKKYPHTRPTVELLESDRINPIKTIVTAEFAYLNANEDDEYTAKDELRNVRWPILVDFREGDVLKFTFEDPDDSYNNEFEIRVVVESTLNNVATLSVLNIPDEIPTGPLTYEVELILEDPVFEYKFPRFAYRYKYLDNQYSTFSPWTEAAFLPGDEFEYDSFHGYNLAMTNNARIVNITDFVPADIPADVKEIDILYKESNNNSIYKVDTIKKDTVTKQFPTEYSIKTELISSVIQSNQILRPWDNVPRKALAQELIGNRIVYGNYLESYNMLDSGGNEINHELSLKISAKTGDNAVIPYRSIKSQRTYQLGVSYIDEYGRQSPVFTSDSASIQLNKKFSVVPGKITASIANQAPGWAKYFKYFIKENSAEYYNLAMDRWYNAEDGNIWLSFPSSERNKVSEETFIELKTKHDKNEAVTENAKYKIIAISNEAPTFIKTFKKPRGSGEYDYTATSEGFPVDGSLSTRIEQTRFDNLFGDSILTSNGTFFISFKYGNNSSSYFEIANITKIEEQNIIYYKIEFTEALDDTVSFMTTNGSFGGRVNDSFIISLYENVEENKAEFDGRFFVKIYKDPALQQYILTSSPEPDWGILMTKEINYMSRNDEKLGHWWFFDESNPHSIEYRIADEEYHYETAPWAGGEHRVGWGLKEGENKFDISWHGFGEPKNRAFANKHWDIWKYWDTNNVAERPQKPFSDALQTVGTAFRFRGDPTETVYKIKDVFRTYYTVSDKRTIGRKLAGNDYLRRVIRYSIKLDKPIAWVHDYTLNSYGREGAIEILQDVSISGDKADYSSKNPAIWETEPSEVSDLDIYYSASDIYPISELTDSKELLWHNCWGFGNGVESNRIRDDYNAALLDKNPIVSAVLEEPYQEVRKGSSMIYSQIFNSISGTNGLNQFIQAEKITKDLNPSYGSIQKLHARDTDLIALAEDKCFRVLANKDALYNADGNVNVTSNFNVLGQATPYVGEFGISKNPESFASYGFRAYFTDKNRGTVLRLSRDGIEEIARKGMTDFFSDNLPHTTSLIGSYDDTKNAYNLTLNGLSPEWQEKLGASAFDRTNCDEVLNGSTGETTVTFKENINGWESRKSFIKEQGLSLNGEYYTFKNGRIWKHASSETHNNFYGVQYDSSLDLIFNENPTSVKVFKTLGYTGTKARDYKYNAGGTKKYSLAEIQAKNLTPTAEIIENGWYTSWIKTDLQEGSLKTYINKEGKYFNYIKGLDTYFNDNCDNNVDSNEFSVQGIGRITSISGDTETTEYGVHVYINENCFAGEYNVHTYIDASCFTESNIPPIAPEIQSTAPAGPFNVGDSYEYIVSATDADSAPSDLTFSSNNLPAGFTLTNNNDGTATISGTTTSGTVSYDITVTDEDNLTDTQQVGFSSLVAGLLDLEFVGSTMNPQPATEWTNPENPNEVVQIAAKENTAHSCNRGTYKIVANRHVNGGVFVGRIFVGNSQNQGGFDSYTLDDNSHPNSITGDAYLGYRWPASQAQYNSNTALGLDGLGNNTTRVYMPYDDQWGNDSHNSRQRYITADLWRSPSKDRITYVQLDQATASAIANNATDPNNANYVTFTAEPDTYTSNGVYNTHTDGFYFQVFKKGSSTEEIFSGAMSGAAGECLAGQPCNAENWPKVTFDVVTGDYIENYDPENP